MKNTRFLCIAFWAFCGSLLPDTTVAQSADIPDPTLIKPPHIIIQTGVSTQWLGGTPRRSAVFSIEHPFGRYEHLGIAYNLLFPDFTRSQSYSYYSSDQYLEKGSYEIGVYYKIFLHGRLTGRKSNLYLAPELKFGQRKFKQEYYTDVFPGPSIPSELHFWENTSKFALRLGAQYQIGPATLDIALPIAVERFKTVNQPYNYYYNTANTHLLLLPSLQFGIGF